MVSDIISGIFRIRDRINGRRVSIEGARLRYTDHNESGPDNYPLLTSSLRNPRSPEIMKRSATFMISFIYCLQRQRAFPGSLSSFKYPPAYGVDFPFVPTLAYI
jgi:hypothetical protein